MNIIIEEIVSDFPVLITEEVVQINISDANSYFDLIEVSDISFEGKNNYVPTVNESTNKIELKPVQGSGFSGSYNDLTDIPNDLVLDADYIHTDNNFTNALKQKLDDTPTSFAPVNATQNSPDSTLLNRSNHTGTQLASTISDFANAVGLIIVSALTGYATENWVISQGFITNVISALGFTPENSANKGTVIGNETSATIYPHAKGVVDYIASLGYQTASMVSSLITSALASFKTSEHLDFTSSGQTQLNNKVDKTSWINYSSTSTITGFSSLTDFYVLYKIIDGKLECYCYFSGVSNAVNITFTLPNVSAFTFTHYAAGGINRNSGVPQTLCPRLSIDSGSNIVTINKDLSGGNYVTSGTKTAGGIIEYKI